MNVASSVMPRLCHSSTNQLCMTPSGAVDLLVEESSDPAHGMNAQVPPDRARGVCDPLAQQQLRRSQGASCEHHRPGADLVAPAILAGGGPDPAGPPVLDDDLLDADVRAHASAGGNRSRELGHMHGLLGVDRAAGRAGAAAAHVAGISGDRPVRDAKSLGALGAELGVAARVLAVDRLDVQRALDLIELGFERAGPWDAELIAPAGQDVVGGAEAGSGVDHGGAADAAPHRHRDQGPALAHGHTAVAVQARSRYRRVGVVGALVAVAALLEDDHVEPGLSKHAGGNRATGTGAHDHDVAVLDSLAGLESSRIEWRGDRVPGGVVRARPAFAGAAGAESGLYGRSPAVGEPGHALGQEQQVPAHAQATPLEAADVTGAGLD